MYGQLESLEEIDKRVRDLEEIVSTYSVRTNHLRIKEAEEERKVCAIEELRLIKYLQRADD